MPFDARAEAHASVGGLCPKGGERHGARCNYWTAAIQRGFDAGLARAEEIARAHMKRRLVAAIASERSRGTGKEGA